MNSLIRSAALSGYVALAHELGLAAAPLLRRVGLSEANLADPDLLIRYPAMIELLERSALASGTRDFGLRLAQHQGLEMLGPLAVVARNARNLAEALSLAERYVFVHSPAIRLEIRPVAGGHWADLCYGIEIAPLPPCRQAIELALGVMVRCLSLLTGGKLRVHRITLPHARDGASLATYELVLGAPCRFEQAVASLRLESRALEQPLPDSNPLLRELAQGYIDTHFSSPEQAFVDRVRLMVQRLLGAGQASHTAVAQMLEIQPRTMQRRLSREGTSFEKIKDEVRRKMLERMLGAADVPTLSMVLGMLDYADPSSLTRSCYRWFGMPPTALGALLRDSQPDRGIPLGVAKRQRPVAKRQGRGTACRG